MQAFYHLFRVLCAKLFHLFLFYAPETHHLFHYLFMQKFASFSDFKSKSSLRCPCSVPEDVPIDLGIIATSRLGCTNVTESGRP